MSRAAESTDTAEKAAMRQVCLGWAVKVRTDRSDMVGQGSLGMLSLGCIRSHEIWQSGIGPVGYVAMRLAKVWQGGQGLVIYGADR